MNAVDPHLAGEPVIASLLQEILDMGGSLDEEEEHELRDTTVLTYEEMEIFSSALRDTAAFLPNIATDEDEDVGGPRQRD